jgi:hypothetical protein
MRRCSGQRGVALVGAEPRVDLRLRESGVRAELQERPLEVAAGAEVAGLVGVDRLCEPAAAGVPVGCLEGRVDVAHVDQPLPLGFLEGANDGVERAAGCEVEERSGEAGGRDVLAGRSVLRREPCSVEGDAVRRVASRLCGDVDPGPAHASHPPQRRGIAVTQHGVGPAREHGRHPPSSHREGLVAQGVNTAIKREEPPSRKATIDRSGAQSELDQLPPGNHTMLPERHLRQGAVQGFVQLTPYIGVRCTHPLSLAPIVLREALGLRRKGALGPGTS